LYLDPTKLHAPLVEGNCPAVVQNAEEDYEDGEGDDTMAADE
jgi:hypothetical protein